jgi:hypothetical protein
LNDVIFWYGISDGIKDGVLKEVRDNIVSYRDTTSEDFLKEVVSNFFKIYKDVTIYDGSPSKLAIYFPQTTDLELAKPIIEKTLLQNGMDPYLILPVHNKSPENIKEIFNNRINDPHLPYRIFLLVNMGTEGWNCLSLFATALARKLSSSNNFVLQAATRCLRQISGNTHKAKIYLSNDNFKLLDSQLQETYGQSLSSLNSTKRDKIKDKLIVRKEEIQSIKVRKILQKLVFKKSPSALRLIRPIVDKNNSIEVTYELKDDPKNLLSEKSINVLETDRDLINLYSVAVDLASIYRFDALEVCTQLKRIYPENAIPRNEIQHLQSQIEKEFQNFELEEVPIEDNLQILKISGFDKEVVDGHVVYTSEFVYDKGKESLLDFSEDYKDSNHTGIGFHYSPYKFDSTSEQDMFKKLVGLINENPDDIEDIFFTGAITDPKKTDFLFEYQDKTGKWRNYTPDFLLRKKDGQCLIIEIKADPFMSEFKESIITKFTELNNETMHYKRVDANKGLDLNDVYSVSEWIYGKVSR